MQKAIHKKEVITTKRYREDGIVRISKQMAKSMYNQGRDIMLTPCNVRPRSLMCPVDVWINNHKKERDVSFDSLCNAYAYYNCNKETGEYISFYIRE